MITVNGKTMQFEEGKNLRLLMKQLGLSDELCAIEINQELVPHSERETYAISSGDEIEIVTLVGGG